MTDNLKIDNRVQKLKDITDIQEKDLNIDDQNQQSSNKNMVNNKINDITGVIRKFDQYQSLVPKDLFFLINHFNIYKILVEH